MGKENNKKLSVAPVVELLEPRVLFSADSLSLLGGALLPDETPNTDLSFDFADDFATANDNSNLNTNEVVFIDSRVPELQSIVDDITANNNASVAVVVINQTDSGIEVVNNTLAQLSNVDAVHLISHGTASSVQLGDDILSNDSLTEHALSLTAWGDALNIGADVLIYGCELGSNDSGLNLMRELAELIGADVAASSDNTGSARLGGDWTLEHSTGQIESNIIVSEALQDDWTHLLAPWDATSNRVLEVSSTLDPALSSDPARYTSVQALIDHAEANTQGVYSLREAIIAINNEDAGNLNPEKITLVLSQNQYSLTLQDAAGDEDASLTGDLDITHKNVTIIGASGDLASGTSTSIRATADVNSDPFVGPITNQQMRVMEAHSTTLTLEGLGITGGIIDEAGAGLLLNNTTAVLNDVYFTENDAMNHSGGGLFSFNNAASAGGVGLSITDSSFTKNHALEGGALRIQAGESVELTNVTFHLNTAIEEGGALYTAAETNIDDSYLHQNTALSGGAIYVANQAIVTTANTTIFNNTASFNGGGVYIDGIFSLNDSSILRLNNSETSHGGGAFLASGTITNPAQMFVNQATIIENNAITSDGGGLYTEAGSSLDMHDAIVRMNTAMSGNGGGIYASGAIEVTNTTFDENRANRGGGLSSESTANPVVTTSTFFNNRAEDRGGAVHVSQGHLYMENVTLAQNRALNDAAGAISVEFGNPNTSATIHNSIVSENTWGNIGVGGHQLSEGVQSAGFNVITRNSPSDQEVHFEQVAQINDIMQIDDGSKHRQNYVVDADLSTMLESHNNSHSEHLTIGADSDALDAGAGDPINNVGAPRMDAYGLEVNEFIDAGAVESHSQANVSKLFFIDAGDSSVFRVNENGRALQQIMVSPNTGIGETYEDIVYDDKSRQLFLIRQAPFSNPLNLLVDFEVHYASADGELDPNSHLRLGGDSTGQAANTDTDFYSLALSVEETDGPTNNLYVAVHSYAEQDFFVLKFAIVSGTDIWTGLENGSPNTPFNPNTIVSIDVDADPNSPGNVVISWADTSDATNAHFHTDKDNPNVTANLSVNGNPNSVVRAVANDTANDIYYYATVHNLWKVPFGSNASTATAIRDGAEIFSDIEFDADTQKLWFTDHGAAAAPGAIGSFDNNLSNPSTELATVTSLSPDALTLASVTTIQLPLVATVNAKLVLDENALATIDTTFLEHDTAANNVAPADIVYTIVNPPGEGQLYLDGVPITATSIFTQLDINNNLLTYEHNNAIVPGTTIIDDSFSFTVDAPNSASTTGVFDIEIDVNEAPVVSVTNPVSMVLEDANNAFIANLAVTDADSPTPTVYVTAIPGGTVASPYVIYDGTNLVQNPGANFDHETSSSIQFSVHAVDDKGLTSTPQTFTIAIGDVNEAPTFSVTNIVSDIDENVTGVVFGSVSVNDVDSPTPNIVVTNVPGGTQPSPHVIFDGTNLIQNPAIEFDHESEPTFSYTVHAIDDQGLVSAEQTFNVTVNNVNEAPAFTVANPISSMAESDTNIVFGTVTATDVDSPAPNILVVDAPGGTTPSPYVILSGNQLIQNPAATFDFETMPSFSYTVYAQDDLGLKSAEQTFTVSLTNTNEAPTFSVTNIVSDIDENVIGVVFGNVSVNDVDSPTPDIVVTNGAGSTSPSPYIIFNGTQLVQNPGAEFNYENIQSFSYTVHAIDDKGLSSAEQTFTVAVNNVNETPAFTIANQISTMAESDTNTVLGTVIATDVDSPTPNIFVVDAPGSINASPYVILSGTDLVQNPTATFDFESMQSFSYTVYTEDNQGLKSGESTYTVTITNTNEAPAFSVENQISTMAESDTNTVFGTVIATDVDSPTPNIFVVDAPGSTNASPYVILSGTDLIQNPTATFDFESMQSFSYTIYTEDNQGLVSEEQTFNVSITNTNEAPSLNVNNLVTSIPESATNAVFGTVTTEDVDSTITSIIITDTPNDNIPSPYVIYQNGQLVQAPGVTFDFESMDTLSFTVQAVDNDGLTSPLQTFDIAITNVNERPTVDQVPDNLTLSEEQPLSLAEVATTDPEEDNVSLSLELSGIFELDSETGELAYTEIQESGNPLPDWIEFDPATQLVTIVGAPAGIERIELALIADDGNGGQSDPQLIFIDIEQAAPALAAAQAPVAEEIEFKEEPTPTIELVEQIPTVETTTEETVEESTDEGPAPVESILNREASGNIDLASLIKPLEGIRLTAIETDDNSITSIKREINITQLDSLDTNINWLNLSDAFSQPSDIQFTELASEFDRQREELAERVANNKTLIGSSFTLSSGLSVGYLLWLIRGGTLMGSVLSSLPAWRLVDPLPVLGSLGEGLDDDDESLESMVNNDDHEPDPDRPAAEAA